MTRHILVTPIALAAALGLVGAGVSLHAQGGSVAALSKVSAGTAQAAPVTRASLRDWEFPGMSPQSDNNSERIVMVTGLAVGDYADSRTMHATLCRRYAHECVSVCLSRDRQSDAIHISLTDTTF